MLTSTNTQYNVYVVNTSKFIYDLILLKQLLISTMAVCFYQLRSREIMYLVASICALVAEPFDLRP